MTADLNTLARDIAEAAAMCVGAPTARTRGDAGSSDVSPCADRDTITVAIAATAALWRAYGDAHGTPGDALNAATVLNLRDRVVAQREERARMLAADDEALRVIDETARVYDEATVMEAAGATGDRAVILRMWLDGEGPWSREHVASALTMAWPTDTPAVLDACDAILRRRAGTP